MFFDALQLVVENTGNQKSWTASLNSGFLSLKNTETNLAKLTLSFDYSASFVRPIIVRVKFFNASRISTGVLQKTVYPATANHFVRPGFELTNMMAVGEGKFNLKVHCVSVSFSFSQVQTINIADGKQEIRPDNFSYTKPTYYVSPADLLKMKGVQSKRLWLIHKLL